MRIMHDSNTHVLTASIIQSIRVLPHKKQQKTYSKIQFYLSLTNKEKSPKYKTTLKEYAEYINFNESFYFPNVENGNFL